MNALPTIDWSIRDTPGKDDRDRPSIDADAFADAVEFLLGSKSTSITGTVLTVDAGGTA